jgi:hypothetical protein
MLVLSTISRMLHLLSVTRDGAEQTYGLRDQLTHHLVSFCGVIVELWRMRPQ